MKNITLSFLILGFLLQGLSCKDDNLKGNVIEGYVLEYGTETPLADVQIDFTVCDGEIFGGITCNKVDEFFTDQNGKFSFNFDQYADDGVFKIFPREVSGYWDIDDRVINKGVNEFTLIADPESYIKVRVKNVDPFDWMDIIAFGGPWGGGSNETIFEGENVDEIVIKKTKGNRQARITWGVRKNSEELVITRDSFYVPAHDTVHFEILY